LWIDEHGLTRVLSGDGFGVEAVEPEFLSEVTEVMDRRELLRLRVESGLVRPGVTQQQQHSETRDREKETR